MIKSVGLYLNIFFLSIAFVGIPTVNVWWLWCVEWVWANSCGPWTKLGFSYLCFRADISIVVVVLGCDAWLCASSVLCSLKCV